MKTKDCITYHKILETIAKIDLGPDANYGVARNLIRLKPIVKEFEDENKVRIEAFCRRDAAGNLTIENNLYDFGESKTLAEVKYNELLEKDAFYEPYKILRSSQTDALPAHLLSELLDIIIVEPLSNQP